METVRGEQRSKKLPSFSLRASSQLLNTLHLVLFPKTPYLVWCLWVFKETERNCASRPPWAAICPPSVTLASGLCDVELCLRTKRRMGKCLSLRLAKPHLFRGDHQWCLFVDDFF